MIVVAIPLKWQKLGIRAYGLLAPLFPVPALAQQEVTYRQASPVTRYKSIAELTKATATLTWTSDPWNGKLDLIKHPTYMQEAIDKHPLNAGDCDCFAAYMCVALDKSQLSDEQWFATAYWVDNDQKIQGHAVCVYRVKEDWFYIGNWNQCRPIPLTAKTAYIWDFERVLGHKVFSATMWRASGTPRDSLALGECIRVMI